MNAMEYWQLFLQTGAPVFYLKYQNARKVENEYVSDDPGAGAAGNTIQG